MKLTINYEIYYNEYFITDQDKLLKKACKIQDIRILLQEKTTETEVEL